MRGVVGGGMVSVFEERGYSDAFDSIHGSSAGACAAAYFAARQARMGVEIYYEDINNKRFIDPLRLILGRPAMDRDFLIDIVMRKKKP
jgi:predicted patatin/cPLA2 family phospholipase